MNLLAIRPLLVLAVVLGTAPALFAQGDAEKKSPEKKPAASPSGKPAAKKRSPKPTPAPNLPPIYDPEAQARASIVAMQTVCQQSNRRMLVNFGTNECAACRVVNDAMHEPAFYDAMIKQFVPLFVDVTPGSPNEKHFLELAARFSMDPKKLPAILILDDKGSFVEATTKGEMAAAAAKGPEDVQRWVVARLYPTD